MQCEEGKNSINICIGFQITLGKKCCVVQEGVPIDEMVEMQSRCRAAVMLQ